MLPFHGKYVFKEGHMDMTFPPNEHMRYYLVITTKQCLQVLNRPAGHLSVLFKLIYPIGYFAQTMKLMDL